MVFGVGACSTADPSGDGDGSTGAAGGDGLETGAGETSATTSNQPDPDGGSSDDGTSEADTAADDAATESDGSDDGETTADGTTAGLPDGPLDCAALCDPYEDCDESVFLTCQSNCLEIVPPLQAFDDACGAASAEYFECRFTLACEDVVAWIGDALDPDPCADLLDDYIDACVAAVPPRCDALCDVQVACLPPDPNNLLGCQFECLLYEGYAVLIDEPACTTATDDLLSCVTEGQCEDTQIVGCEATFDTYTEACCPGLPNCDA